MRHHLNHKDTKNSLKLQLIEFFFRSLNFLKRKIFFYKKINLDRTDIELTLNPKNFKKLNFKLPKGYNLRFFSEKDSFQFHLLLLKVDMGFCPISYWKKFIIPNGFLVVEKSKTKKIVGVGFAAVHPNSIFDEIGTIEWLAADPKVFGLGIGPIIVSYLSEMLIKENFKKIRVNTQRYRKNVISMYEKMGWEIEKKIIKI